MSDITTLMMAAAGGAAEETDANFNQTVLLLHGDGTDGMSNTDFEDSSTNNFTITPNGNVTQGTFSPFSAPDGRWSNYFDGSSYFTSSTALFNYTTGNAATQTFTIEAWVYHIARTTPSFAYYSQSIAAKGDVYLNLGINGSGNLVFHHYSGVSTTITGSSVIPLNTWTHVAVVVSGGTATIYINGVSDGSDTWGGIDAGGQNSTSFFGSPSGNASAQEFQGYISNLRVSSTARSITVPTTPYTNDGNTVFLIEQSNRFIDNSTNGYALAVVGSPKVTPFSPFAPTAAYDASVNGGSGYFDGSGDYLGVASNAALAPGTGDFTVEGWINFSSLPAVASPLFQNDAVGVSNNGKFWFGLLYESGTYKLYISRHSTATDAEVAWTPAVGAWYHIAVVRESGTIKMFIDGVSQSVTNSTAFNGISFDQNGASVGVVSSPYYHHGYISNFRYTVGDALYTATFTPITEPLTTTSQGASSSQVEILLNFTNAGIFDNTGKNNLETVGNAQIDTTTKKYGTGALEFDGTGDYLVIPDSPLFSFGSGPFTIEFWIYPSATANTAIIDARASATNVPWGIFYDSADMEPYFYTGSSYKSSTALSTGAWQHLAVTRDSSNTLKMFLDGVEVHSTGSVTTSLDRSGTILVGINKSSANALTGYIDDLRITKGVARYTTTFTPPTKAFPDL